MICLVPSSSKFIRTLFLLALTIATEPCVYGQTEAAATAKKIILIAGETALVDVAGHHDYLAGCACLDILLRQTSNIEPVQVKNGWPMDESVFSDAKSVVFYTDGGGSQAFLKSPNRIATVQALVDEGVGIVMIHQAVDFPDVSAELAKGWLGGVYSKSVSGRGHWDSNHVDFPKHPVTNGVMPWKVNDGWLNAIQFVDGMKNVTPLVWSGKQYAGSRSGLDNDIVAWAYERPKGGRSFSFTGLDAHSAWSLAGMRQLVVNGVLWSAGLDIPIDGSKCQIEDAQLERMLTPRTPKKPASK